MVELKRRRLSKSEREKVYQKCRGHCAYCGCTLDYKDMQVDHVKPLRAGVSDEISNMLPTCRSCNHYKATLDLEQFREYVHQIPERLNRDNIQFQVGFRFGVVSCQTGPVKFYFEEQPTSFDVDKVVSELKRDKFIESECILSDVHQGYNAGLSRAIEIVKGCGIE